MASTRFLAEYVYLTSYEYFQNNLEGEFFFVFFYSVFLDYTRLKNVKVWIKAAASYVQRNWICQVMYVVCIRRTLHRSFKFHFFRLVYYATDKVEANDEWCYSVRKIIDMRSRPIKNTTLHMCFDYSLQIMRLQ